MYVQMKCISSLPLKSHKAFLCLLALWYKQGVPEESQGLHLLSEQPWESLFEASHLVSAEGLKNSGISHNR